VNLSRTCALGYGTVRKDQLAFKWWWNIGYIIFKRTCAFRMIRYAYICLYRYILIDFIAIQILPKVKLKLCACIHILSLSRSCLYYSKSGLTNHRPATLMQQLVAQMTQLNAGILQMSNSQTDNFDSWRTPLQSQYRCLHRQWVLHCKSVQHPYQRWKSP
jgi:hypothetical protein